MEAYYIIPMTVPPYSKESPQRPQYVDEIRCNWTGHNVDELGVFICKVNTTDSKHTDLTRRQGVFQLPRDYTWTTPLSTLKIKEKTAISNWCTNKSIPYDENETIGQLLMRIIATGLFSLGNSGLTTIHSNLTQTQKNKISSLCNRWNISYNDTDSISTIVNKCGPMFWPGDKLYVEEG